MNISKIASAISRQSVDAIVKSAVLGVSSQGVDFGEGLQDIKDAWRGMTPLSRGAIRVSTAPYGGLLIPGPSAPAANVLAHPDVAALRHKLKGGIAEGAKALSQSEAGAAALAAQRDAAEADVAKLKDELVATGGRSVRLPEIDKAPSIFQRIGEGIGSGAQAGGMREQLSNYLMDPENRTKLMLGTGAGALGIGGLAAYLATRKKKNEDEE